ncbi:hypothetical protein QOT17_007430 [Balamuthia mandrillaris]
MADNNTPDRMPDFRATAKRMGNGLSTLLATYSECMYDIIEFQRKAASDSDPDAYAKVSKSEMDMAERPSRTKRVNSCRSLTKDYWRTVLRYARAYGYMDSLERNEFAHQHESFKRFVKPLDTLHESDDSSEALYDLANFTPTPPE